MTRQMTGCRITTGSRLHFGLWDVSAPFGGCGVMVDRPSTVVETRPAESFIVTGTKSPAQTRRVIDIVDRVVQRRNLDHRPPIHVHVEKVAPAHQGYGSGTQLNLAVAESILTAIMGDGTSASMHDIVSVADRGKRSAVGSHGYFQGGFIAESTDRDETGIGASSTTQATLKLNPVAMRCSMPTAWRVAICVPTARASTTEKDGDVAVAGELEQQQFDRLPPVTDSQRVALMEAFRGLTTSIERNDFDHFCDSLHRYNQSSGDLFAAAQGGPYNGPAATSLVHRLCASGYGGVGQTSWGPGIFVWFASEADAQQFKLNSEFGKQESETLTVTLARPMNAPRRIETTLRPGH
ncbi:MAG: beta-ribofuranosylaminobenzene 5'-phosphate synthase [Planctomycetota bacterium]